jgi:hypothetical protein
MNYAVMATAQVHPCSTLGPGEIVVGEQINGSLHTLLCDYDKGSSDKGRGRGRNRTGSRSANEDNADNGNTSAPPPEKWAARYGALAFAYDSAGNNSVLGTAGNETSQAAANSAALQNCKSQGGYSCRILFAYRNECVASVWGEKSATYGDGATEGKAIQKAVDACHKHNSHCRVRYSSCSMPVRVQ